ncbi:MAG: hypothetical protein M9958_00230 [Chitinophagales bacterium]|nr:hypothetical protein [Chitinophagales bacterium]
MKTNNLSLIYLVFILSTLTLNSCSKDKQKNDEKTIKLKQVVTTFDGSSFDTLKYIYTGDDVKTISSYSNSPTIYTWIYTKNENKYDMSIYNGTTLTHNGFYEINAQGYLDSLIIINLATSTINNRDKYYYNSNGYNVRSISNHITYINDIYKYYNSDGDFTYWIYNFEDNRVPANPFIDSITFEYYPNELKVPIDYALQDKFGKNNKHLVKKRNNYDRATATLKKTYEYIYEFDSKGLVTKRFLKIFSQPGNILISSEQDEYSYYE